MAKVSEMTRSTGTPISGTMVLSHEIARIAMPDHRPAHDEVQQQHQADREQR